MPKRSTFLILSTLILTWSAPAVAADDFVRLSPYIKEDYYLTAGLFFPQREFELQLDGSASTGNDSIDFSEQFRLGGSEQTEAIEFGWRFKPNWSLRAQHLDIDAHRTTTLTSDVQWGDFTYEEGTAVSAGTGITVTRIFFGRRMSPGNRSEFGVGAGLHLLQLDAFVKGDAMRDGLYAGIHKESAQVSGPLPNLGAWYMYSLSRRWAVAARADWLSADVDSFDGSIINAALGVDYAVTRHLGAGLSYNYFELDAGLDDSNWKGDATIRFDGVYLHFSAYW